MTCASLSQILGIILCTAAVTAVVTLLCVGGVLAISRVKE